MDLVYNHELIPLVWTWKNARFLIRVLYESPRDILPVQGRTKIYLIFTVKKVTGENILSFSKAYKSDTKKTKE